MNFLHSLCTGSALLALAGGASAASSEISTTGSTVPVALHVELGEFAAVTEQELANDRFVPNRGPREGDWEVTLGGTGFNNQDFDAGGFSLSGSLGKFMSDDWEVSVRQTYSYSDSGSTIWNGSTRLAADFHFGDGTFQPVLGANVGYVYGESIHDTLAAAPEAGFKWYFTGTTFLQLLGEYQFFFDNVSDANDAFDDGQFIYTLGLGVNF